MQLPGTHFDVVSNAGRTIQAPPTGDDGQPFRAQALAALLPRKAEAARSLTIHVAMESPESCPVGTLASSTAQGMFAINDDVCLCTRVGGPGLCWCRWERVGIEQFLSTVIFEIYCGLCIKIGRALALLNSHLGISQKHYNFSCTLLRLVPDLFYRRCFSLPASPYRHSTSVRWHPSKIRRPPAR